MARVRVALMAVTDMEGVPVRLGGKPVAWHQLQALLSLGCERIICLAGTHSPALASLQREAEARGTKFNPISHHRALSGLVRAADTLFVLAPGVLPERDWLRQALGARTGIGVFPADAASERGFERIDRERAWAGVLATRGDAVEALADLPTDADPVAGLLRVSLQRGGRCLEISGTWLDDGRWALLEDEAAVRRVEESWQARHFPAPALDRPGEALAHLIARLLLTRAPDRPEVAPLLATAGTILAVAGGVAGYAGHTLAGVAALTLGTIVAQMGERLVLFARAGSGDGRTPRFAKGRDVLLDLSLVAIAASPHQFTGWQVAFVGAVLVAALRLAREDEVSRPVRPFGDRATVFAVLVLAAGLGFFAPAGAAIALLALGLRLFWPSPRD